MSQDPLVRNANSEKQVKEADKKLALRRLNQLEDLRWVLSDPRGRRMLWRLLEKCKTFQSVWDASARIHFNAGQQDIGHWAMAEITEARPQAFFDMMLENRTKELANG